jgi:hypothetical protein
MAFEIWFYRGLIGILLVVIWWIWQQRTAKQEELNEKFFDILDRNEQAITRLNTILDANDKVCNERHININRRLDNLER